MSSGKKVARGATLYSKKRSDKHSETKIKTTDVKELTTINKPIRDQNYESKLIDYLGQVGIEVSSYKTKYIIRRLRVRMGRIKITSYKEYLEFIKHNPNEIKEIQESLSINVTRFFRNKDTYELIRTKILPDLLIKAKKQNRQEIRIWSAGCAVGAEPYSLAMICSNSIASQIDIRIQATDIKNELLAIARNGVYSEGYVAEMDDHDVHKFFKINNDHEYEISPILKKMISFSHHDLMKDNYPSNLDIIVCRNVLIYVDREAQTDIVAKFFNALRPGGILVLGRTETLFGDWRNHVDIISTKHRIYQKKGNTTKVYKIQKIDKNDARAKKIIHSKSKLNQQRLDELRDFRNVFEQRKRIWTKRIEKKEKDKKHQLKPVINREPRGKVDFNFSSRINKNTSRHKSSGKLSNYRALLKKPNTPVKVAKIRKDMEPVKILKNPLNETPSEIYKRIIKMKERKDERRKR